LEVGVQLMDVHNKQFCRRTVLNFHPFSRLATAVTMVTSGGDYLLKFGGFKVLKNL